MVAGLAPARETPKNVPAGTDTMLGWLADVVPVPPLRTVVSVGDLLLALGVAVLVAALMRGRPRPREEVIT